MAEIIEILQYLILILPEVGVLLVAVLAFFNFLAGL